MSKRPITKLLEAVVTLSAIVVFSSGCPGDPPGVSLRSNVPDPAGASPIAVEVTFTAWMNGFTASDVATSNAAVANFSGFGSNYTFDLVPAGEGVVSAQVPANAAKDWGGLGNAESEVFTRVYDGTPPSVTVITTPGGQKSVSPVPVDVVFSEPVTGFTASDVVTTNANVANFAGSGTTYYFELVPPADGEVTAAIPAGVAHDAAGNGNTAAPLLSFYYDASRPKPALSSPAADPTNAAPVLVAVTFSEAVTGFDASDLAVVNGSVGGFTGSGTDYSFDLIPLADGVMTVNISADVAVDAGGNGNAPAEPFSRVGDYTPPAAALSSGTADPTNQSPIPVAVVFSEPVAGFEAADIVTTNGVVSGFSGGGASYTFDLMPAGNGAVTALVGAGAAYDGAGNGNDAAPAFSRIYSGSAPSVALDSPETSPTNAASIPVAVSFSEPVTGFEAADIAVSNAAVQGFSGSGAQYGFNLIPAADGPVSAAIPAGAAINGAGTGNTAATPLSLAYDCTVPTAAMTSPAGDPTNVSPIPVTVTFCEPVLGFSAGDVSAENATVSGFAGSGADYSFYLVPGADGWVKATVDAGVAQDEAGNANAAAETFLREFNGTAPSVLLSSSASNPTNATPIPVAAVFSEPVVGFGVASVTASNATVSGFAGSGSDYAFNLVPIADGEVSASIGAGVAQDEAGNGNTTSDSLTLEYDGTGPSVSLASSAGDPTGLSPIPVTAAFSEAVLGFDAADVAAVNGSISNFAGSGADYSFDLVPAAAGTVEASIAAGAAQDAAGNACGGGTISRTYDNSAPTVALSSTALNPTGASPIAVAVVFSEAVLGFEAADVTTGNGSVSNFAGGGASYSFDLVPAADGTVTAAIPAGAAQDTSGQDCTASETLSRMYDGTGPTVAMSSGAPDPVEDPVIPVTVLFGEAVVFFDATDIVASNATVENFGGFGAHYGFDLVAASDGLVTADIPAAAAWDVVGNESAAALQFARQYDAGAPNPAPTVTISTTAPNPTANFPIPVSVEFSEPVTGFQAADIAVGNGVVGTFGGAGASYSLELVPNDEGQVTADIAAGAALGQEGQGNEAAEQFCITYLAEPAGLPEAVIEVNEGDYAIGRRQLGYYSGVAPTCSYAPLAVFLEGWKSTPREEIAEYLWDFGDGSEPFQGFNAAHVYEQPGLYTVTLTVTNELGWTATDTLEIEALERDGVTYYVDAVSGNDGNAGTSSGAAWRTAGHALNRRLDPGDGVLFRRGQTFGIDEDAIAGANWRDRYGFMLGAYGDGPKPLLQLVGTNAGELFPGTRMAYIAVVDLAFQLTSSEGARATLFAAGSAQNALFLRCDIEDGTSGFLLQGDTDSVFVVDCTSYGTYSSHIYTKCSRIAIHGSSFDYGVNSHIAYLSTIDKGVITGSTFSRPVRGRHAFRLSGSKGTNNVVITGNTFTGWIDPLNGGNHGSGDGYNWLLVHLAPNTSDFQTMTDVLFEGNLLQDAKTLLNIGNYQNLIVRGNTLSTLDTGGANMITIGGMHNWDSVPVEDVTVTENIIWAPPAGGASPIVGVLPYSGSEYQGRTRHEDIRIEKNVVLMDEGVSRLLQFEQNDPAQTAEFHTDNQVVYAIQEDPQLFQVGGTAYTLAEWQQQTGCSAGTVVLPYQDDPHADQVAPVPGWANSFASVQGSTVPVAFQGAFDLGGAGLQEVRLWACVEDGPWQDTGLAVAGYDGQFEYPVPGGQTGVVCAFALRARDQAGNESPVPAGSGHCETFVMP